MEQELPLQPSSNMKTKPLSNHVIMSYHWVRLLLIATVVKSFLGLINLFFLLLGSTSVLIIGYHFRDRHFCPMEPNISFFLIIAGSVSIEWIILSSILSIITIVLKRIQSITLVILIISISLIIVITNLFLFVWVIFGSIWTLKPLDKVQYINPHINTFCHQTLYKFTLGYLIVTYILSALQCWYRLCILVFCSIQQY